MYVCMHVCIYRFIGLLLDEIYIREDIVYDRHSSRLIGFVNLGDVDKQLTSLEMTTSGQIPAVSTRILTVMVRGIFSRLQFPLANFPTAGVTAVELHDIMWEAVEKLERCDFRVVSLSGDGCSPHRRFFRLHQASSEVPHKAVNVYSQDQRILYFFSDAPHLIKTARNSLSHSGYHRTRLLWVSVCM